MKNRVKVSQFCFLNSPRGTCRGQHGASTHRPGARCLLRALMCASFLPGRDSLWQCFQYCHGKRCKEVSFSGTLWVPCRRKLLLFFHQGITLQAAEFSAAGMNVSSLGHMSPQRPTLKIGIAQSALSELKYRNLQILFFELFLVDLRCQQTVVAAKRIIRPGWHRSVFILKSSLSLEAEDCLDNDLLHLALNISSTRFTHECETRLKCAVTWSNLSELVRSKKWDCLQCHVLELDYKWLHLCSYHVFRTSKNGKERCFTHSKYS
jgi:hypothetical protein